MAVELVRSDQKHNIRVQPVKLWLKGKLPGTLETMFTFIITRYSFAL